MRGKKLLKNITFTLLYQIIAIASGFIIPKAIISHYGSSVNGLISSIAQFLAYIYIVEGGVSAIIKYLLYKPIAENNKNEKICYGYMEHKPKDYWISVNGEKISLD